MRKIYTNIFDFKCLNYINIINTPLWNSKLSCNDLGFQKL